MRHLLLLFFFFHLPAAEKPSLKFIHGPDCIVIWDARKERIHYLYNDGRNETRAPHVHSSYTVLVQNEPNEFYTSLRSYFKSLSKSAARVE